MKERWIYKFEELGQEHNDLVGKKCANLGEMTKIGIPVPPGFALSVHAYTAFMDQSGARDDMRAHLDKLGNLPETTAEWDALSVAFRVIVEAKRMPKEMEDMVLSHYDDLCKKVNIPDVAVSTRSAGAVSHPGQYETYLNVQGKPDLLKHIIKVWSSSFNTRSLMYRARNDMPIEYDPIGVAVPKMVKARAAGVGFTADPNTGEPKILFEANWGLGESVVSGNVTPDSFVLDRDTLNLVEKKLGNKLSRIVYSDVGVKEEDISPDEVSSFCLTDEEAKEIARLCLVIEDHFGVPQDTEWSVDADLEFPDSIFFLQTRPITTIKKPKSTSNQLLDMMMDRFYKV